MLEREEPCFFDDRLEEETAEMLDGLDEFLTVELGCEEALGFDMGGVGCIGLDGLVVCWKRDGEAVKGVVILESVVGVIIEKARDAIGAARDDDGLEEVREDLGGIFDVVVGWGARDGREVRCGVGKESFCILRRSHGVLG